MISQLLRRLSYYFRRNQFESDLEEEMRHHIALKEEALKQEDSALTREAARKAFGNVTLLKEHSRSAWTWTFWEQLLQDLRYALRAMAQNWVFTALAALSLALGIGANTAIYSFMDSILLRSLPVPDPQSLVMLNWHAQGRGSLFNGKPLPTGSVAVMKGMSSSSGSTYYDAKTGYTGGIFPYPAFELLRKNDKVFSSLFIYYQTGLLNLTVKGQTDLAGGEFVSGDYFRGLEIAPVFGRLIAPGDDQGGAAPVAVVTPSFGQRRFGNPAAATGQSILINNVAFTVIGVTPPEFYGVDPAQVPDFYVPLHTNLLLDTRKGPRGFGIAERYTQPNMYWIEMMARLQPGVSRTQAQAELAPPFLVWVSSTAANDGERADLPQLILKEGAAGLDALRRQYSKPLYVLITLVGLILAIACANIANLLLARASARRREIALRLSVGASRIRIVRQLLTESVLLAFSGGALGLLFAVWGIRFLTLLLANGRANFTLRADLNWHVLLWATGLSLLTGLVFGLIPALQSTRVDVMPALKENKAWQPRKRVGFLHVNLSHILVVSQIAISLLILVAAGLFLRTLSNLETIELGFNRNNLLLFQMNPSQAGHRPPEISTFYQNLRREFAAIPGIQSATLTNNALANGGTMGIPVFPAGTEKVLNSPHRVLTVGPDYFNTMQIRLLLGRGIEERDHAGSNPIAVIDELYAKMFFGSENPIGRHLIVSDGVTPLRDTEIVGVSRSVRYGNLKRDMPPTVFLPFDQGFPDPTQMTFTLRTGGDPLVYANTVREIVRRADPHVPVFGIKTQTQAIDETINPEITFAELCTAFAILALTISCVGLYGAMAYNVTRRTSEIGIRMALGAKRAGVVWMVLREVLILSTIALAISIPIALGAGKLIASFLWGMKPTDPWALAASVAILGVSAIIAGYAPARRAAKVEPVIALRHE
jgi:predicted permease